jgi:hypothetical protein
MSFPQQLFLAFSIAGFLGFPAALFYGWIVTEAWKPSNRSPSPPVSETASHAERAEVFAEAA